MTVLERATWVHTIGGAIPVTTSACFIFDSALSSAQRLSMANLAQDTWGSEVMPYIPSVITLQHTDVQEVDVIGGKLKPVSVATQSETDAVSGGDGAASLPPQMSFVVSLKTALAGRRYRGRMYLPPVLESKVGGDGSVDSTLAESLAGGVEATVDAIEADWVGLNAAHVIVSRKFDLATEVVQYIGRTLIHVQRRRKPLNLVG